MAVSLKSLGQSALDEIKAVVTALPDGIEEPLSDALLTSGRIALHGLGREGLMMRAFVMRLFHLGLDAHVVGDMTTPPLGNGDLLIVSCGPGALATHDALIARARSAGATIAVVTAQPEGPTSRLADIVVFLPAQTMADDRRLARSSPSVLPMGSLFEMTQLLFFELVVIKLRDRLGETMESMRARHTNLE
ncbi:MAG: SIS domain-containing protein [Methylobacteriaceae bacterium]|nr:SIS domain-containing protein [Methylobacteriaceae bacterium]